MTQWLKALDALGPRLVFQCPPCGSWLSVTPLPGHPVLSSDHWVHQAQYGVHPCIQENTWNKNKCVFFKKKYTVCIILFWILGDLKSWRHIRLVFQRKSRVLKTRACHRNLGDRDVAGERRRMSGTGLTGGCQLTAVGTENWTLVTFKRCIISTLHCRIIPLATVAISKAGLVTLTMLSCKTITAIHLQSSVHHAEGNSNRPNSHFPLPSPSLRPSPSHSVAVYLTAPAASGKQNHTGLACSWWPHFSVHPCCEDCQDFMYSFLWVKDMLRAT